MAAISHGGLRFIPDNPTAASSRARSLPDRVSAPRPTAPSRRAAAVALPPTLLQRGRERRLARAPGFPRAKFSDPDRSRCRTLLPSTSVSRRAGALRTRAGKSESRILAARALVDERFEDRVAQLADVSRPRIGAERAQRVRRGSHRSAGAGFSLCEAVEEVPRQRRQIVDALAQAARDGSGRWRGARRGRRRTRPRRRAARRSRLVAATMPEVHFVPVVLAEPADDAILEHAQQLHLRLERRVVDLVEEHRAARLRPSAGRRSLHGARERAARVAEELGLHQLVGNRRAVDRHEAAVLRRGDHA